jgi:hypothetical protein
LLAAEGLHDVDWFAIIAVVIISLTFSSVVLAFGSTLGIFFAFFQFPETAPAVGLFSLAAGSWFFWI